MARHAWRTGRLALACLLAALLTSAWAAPAAFATTDTAGPAVSSFTRTSPATINPGDTVSVSYSASDATGVATVVFHFTDLLGVDHAVGGSGTTGPASVSSADWPSGPFRLDSITATDTLGNQITYVAGGTTFKAPGTTGPNTHNLNLDAGNFTISGAAPAKSAISGVIDRNGPVASGWQSVINDYVVRVDWRDLQPMQGGGIA